LDTGFAETRLAGADLAADFRAAVFVPERDATVLSTALVRVAGVLARGGVIGCLFQSRKIAQRCRSWRVHPTVSESNPSREGGDHSVAARAGQQQACNTTAPVDVPTWEDNGGQRRTECGKGGPESAKRMLTWAGRAPAYS
jgi:hypothetical protein